jgi:hypothetical protein
VQRLYVELHIAPAPPCAVVKRQHLGQLLSCRLVAVEQEGPCTLHGVRKEWVGRAPSTPQGGVCQLLWVLEYNMVCWVVVVVPESLVEGWRVVPHTRP